MEQAVANVENLGLPLSMRKKIRSKKVLIREVPNGILISPLKTPPNLRGKYKGEFSTEQYLAQKKKDKEIEE